MALDTAARTPAPPSDPAASRLPVAALIALATAAFVTCLTETLPAGVLPAMGASFGVGDSAMGQAITVYAAGTALTAIPLTTITARWRRRTLLLVAMAGFAATNTLTALSTAFAEALIARSLAGVAAGLAWSLLAGYAARIAPPHLSGRAIAVALAGIPIALSLGVPGGTLLGDAFGWRVPFLVMSGVTVVLLGCILAVVPDLPGDDRLERPSARAAIAIPGVAPVLLVTLLFVVGHTALYAFVSPVLGHAGMGGSTGAVLLGFGLASMVGLWLVGAMIDRRLRAMTIIGTLIVAGAAMTLALAGQHRWLVYPAVAVWGLGWGGIPTLLQTAISTAGRSMTDVVQAMLVTVWNLATAAGGVVGGLLLAGLGAGGLPWAVPAILAPALLTIVLGRRYAFPAPAVAGPGR